MEETGRERMKSSPRKVIIAFHRSAKIIQKKYTAACVLKKNVNYLYMHSQKTVEMLVAVVLFVIVLAFSYAGEPSNTEMMKVQSRQLQKQRRIKPRGPDEESVEMELVDSSRNESRGAGRKIIATERLLLRRERARSNAVRLLRVNIYYQQRL